MNHVEESNREQNKESLAWIVEPLLAWYKKQARELPWRETNDPYRVWVSEIMLQQTRVEAVIPYFNRFMDNFHDIEDLASAPEAQVLKLWEGLGYYSRARNLKKAAKIICEEYQGTFPKKYQDILKLPGIGKYTAGAISSIAFGQPCSAVDGNVLRVITRLEENENDNGDEKFKKQIGERLEEIYPQKKCSEFTQSLMELGAVICIPNGEPKCRECPLRQGCGAYLNNTWQKYPMKQKKIKRKKIDKTVLILDTEEKIAVRKRGQQGLLAGLWELPNIDRKMDETEIKKWLKGIGIQEQKIEKYKNTKHIFTHLEWNMYCYRVICKEEKGEFEWVSKNELEAMIPLPTAFRKCL